MYTKKISKNFELFFEIIDFGVYKLYTYSVNYIYILLTNPCVGGAREPLLMVTLFFILIYYLTRYIFLVVLLSNLDN